MLYITFDQGGAAPEGSQSDLRASVSHSLSLGVTRLLCLGRKKVGGHILRLSRNHGRVCRAGILGENLQLPKAITADVSQFWAVNGITLIICLLSFLAIMGYIRWRRLL